VMLLMHRDLMPPPSLEGYTEREIAEWKTEYDVMTCLEDLGHEVRPVGVHDDLGVIRREIDGFSPQIVFNLLEEFHGVAAYNAAVVSYIELLRKPYTGCNPRGLLLSRDKALSKKLLAYHRIPVPKFQVYPIGRTARPAKKLAYPLLVKSLVEEASLGISQASLVHNDEKLIERVEFVHRHVGTDAIAEEYIDGRELYVGMMGNQRLTTYPIWEMHFADLPEGAPRIATAKVKWDHAYQKKIGLTTRRAENLDETTEQQIIRLCKRAYRALDLSGYSRMDLRLADDGRVYLLEANPNPHLAYGEDFAESAASVGVTYPELIQRIVNLGLRFRPLWRTAAG